MSFPFRHMDMIRPPRRRASSRTWRVFGVRDGRHIAQQLRALLPPRCPCCGDLLEARPDSRLARSLPLGAVGHDLDCRGCRRFWCVCRHTERSLRLLRMRRLAAAVCAVPLGSPGRIHEDEPLVNVLA